MTSVLTVQIHFPFPVQAALTVKGKKLNSQDIHCFSIGNNNRVEDTVRGDSSPKEKSFNSFIIPFY